MDKNIIKDTIKKILFIMVALAITLGMAPLLTSANRSDNLYDNEDIVVIQEPATEEQPTESEEPNIDNDNNKEVLQDLIEENISLPSDTNESSLSNIEESEELPENKTERLTASNTIKATTIDFGLIFYESNGHEIYNNDPRIINGNGNHIIITDLISKFSFSASETISPTKFTVYSYNQSDAYNVGSSLSSGTAAQNANLHSFNFSSLSEGTYTIKLDAKYAVEPFNRTMYVVLNIAKISAKINLNSSYKNSLSIAVNPILSSNDISLGSTTKTNDITNQWTVLDINGSPISSGEGQMSLYNYVSSLPDGSYKLSNVANGITRFNNTVSDTDISEFIIAKPEPQINLSSSLNPRSILLTSKYPLNSSHNRDNSTQASDVSASLYLKDANDYTLIETKSFENAHSSYLFPVPSNNGNYKIELSESISGITLTKSAEFIIANKALNNENTATTQPEPAVNPDPNIEFITSSTNPTTINLTSKNINKTDAIVTWLIKNDNNTFTKNGNFDDGVNTHTIDVASENLVPGNYTIELTEVVNSLIKTATANFTISKVPSPKITFPNDMNDNPTTVKLQSDEKQGISMVSWSITNSNGESIKQDIFEDGKNNLDLDIAGYNLPSGIYTIELVEVSSNNITGKDTQSFVINLLNAPKPSIEYYPNDLVVAPNDPEDIHLASEFVNNPGISSSVSWTIRGPQPIMSSVTNDTFPLGTNTVDINVDSLSLANGEYTIELTEISSAGVTGTAIRNFVITNRVSANLKPQIKFNSSSNNPISIDLIRDITLGSKVSSKLSWVIKRSNGVILTQGDFASSMYKQHLNVADLNLPNVSASYTIELTENADDKSYGSTVSTFTINLPNSPKPTIEFSPLNNSIDPELINMTSQYPHNSSISLTHSKVTWVIKDKSKNNSIIYQGNFPDNVNAHFLSVGSFGLDTGDYSIELTENASGANGVASENFTISNAPRIPAPTIVIEPSSNPPTAIVLNSLYTQSPSTVSWIIVDSNNIPVTASVSFFPNTSQSTLTVADLNLKSGKYTIILTEEIDSNSISTSESFWVQVLGAPKPSITFGSLARAVFVNSVDPTFIELQSEYIHNPLTSSFVQWRILDANGVELNKGTFVIGEKKHDINVSLLALPVGNYTVELTELYRGMIGYATSTFSISTSNRAPDPSVLAVDMTGNSVYDDPARINLTSKYSANEGANISWAIKNAMSITVSSGSFVGEQKSFNPTIPQVFGVYTVTITETIDNNTVSKSANFNITKINPSPSATVDKNPDPTKITLTSKYPHDPHINSTVNWTVIGSNNYNSSGTFVIGSSVYYPTIPDKVGIYTATVSETIAGITETSTVTFNITEITPAPTATVDQSYHTRKITLTSRYPHNPGVNSTVTWQIFDQYNRVYAEGKFPINAISYNPSVPSRAGNYRVVVTESIVRNSVVEKTKTAEANFTISRSNGGSSGWYSSGKPANNNQLDRNPKNIGSASRPTKPTTTYPVSGGTDLTKPRPIVTSPNINQNPTTGS